MTVRREPPEPSVSVWTQPAPHGPWSSNNNFGFELPFRAALGSRERVINLPEWGEPSVWTVSLGIDYADNAWPSESPLGFEVVAEVSYGVGGATETVLMDWIQGTTFSVPANAISINAYCANSPSLSASQKPSDVMLRVLLARGSRGTGVPPTKFAPLLNGDHVSVLQDNALTAPLARIPKFARKLFVVPVGVEDAAVLAGGEVFARFFSTSEPQPPLPPDLGSPSTTASNAAGTYPVTRGALLAGIPVPPLAKYVALEHVGGAANSARSLFNFSLHL